MTLVIFGNKFKQTLRMDWFKDKILPLRARLIKYANSVLADNNEAEDIVQEAFIKIWRSKAQMEKHPNVESLAYVVTKNLALNRKKVLDRKTSYAFENMATEEGQPATTDEQGDKTKTILKIVETLPSLQRSIFTLKHIEGYETEEIAQITGSTIEAVRMNLSRARKRIRDIYLNETL